MCCSVIEVTIAAGAAMGAGVGPADLRAARSARLAAVAGPVLRPVLLFTAGGSALCADALEAPPASIHARSSLRVTPRRPCERKTKRGPKPSLRIRRSVLEHLTKRLNR